MADNNSDATSIVSKDPRLHLHSLLTKAKEEKYDHIALIFQILKSHPDEAKLYFPLATIDEATGREIVVDELPLVHLLSMGNEVPFEMIQEVYQMNKVAIMTADSYGSYPLHFAVEYRCNIEVIKFLVENFEKAASMSGHRHGLPIYTLVGRHGWEYFDQAFQLLYNAHPPHKWRDIEEWQKLLAQVFVFQYPGTPPETPPSLLKWLAKQEKKRPPVRRYDQELGRWTEVPTTELLRHDPTFGRYTEVLRYDTAFGGWTKEMIDDFIGNLNEYIPNLHDNCEALEFNFCGSRMEDTLLGRLFSKVDTITPALKIRICGLGWFNDWGAATSTTTPTTIFDSFDWTSCQLTHLTLSKFRVTAAESYDHLLHCLQQLPNLANLYLEQPTRRNLDTINTLPCTCAIISLLEGKAATLNELTVIGEQFADLNVEKICEALGKEDQASTALVRYYQHDKATFNFPKVNIEVAFLSSMNKHGRTQLIAPNATRELLENCLSSVNVNLNLGEYKELKQSLLFGLLLVAPGLWHGFGSNRSQKKRSATEEPMELPEPKKMK